MSKLSNHGIHIELRGESNEIASIEDEASGATVPLPPILDIAVRCSCGASVVGMFTTGTLDRAYHSFMASHADDCPVGIIAMPAL